MQPQLLEYVAHVGGNGVLREHIRSEHPQVKPPSEEQLEAVVTSASYGVLYVPVDEQDGLEEEGFGPEPY